jgi:cell wall assembly regulator SMI1
VTDIRDSWARLEAWFSRHRPDVDLRLREGASDDQIASLEAAFGEPLPEDVRASLRIHDGQDFLEETPASFLPAGWLHPVASLRDYLARWDPYEVSSEDNHTDDPFTAPDRRFRHDQPSRKALPWLGNAWFEHDVGYLDLAPGSTGTHGQILICWAADWQVLAPDWPSLLGWIASGLESGELVYGDDEVVPARGGEGTEGLLTWLRARSHPLPRPDPLALRPGAIVEHVGGAYLELTEVDADRAWVRYALADDPIEVPVDHLRLRPDSAPPIAFPPASRSKSGR